MSTKNDKTTTNNIQVSKRHVENAKGIRLDMIFFFLGNKSTKTLKVEDIKVLNMMLKGTKGNKKYIGDVINTKVLNIIYIYIK
jgi:hypothetical protein